MMPPNFQVRNRAVPRKLLFSSVPAICPEEQFENSGPRGVRENEALGAGGFEVGGLIALEGGNQFIQGGIGADFVVRVIRFPANFPVWE